MTVAQEIAPTLYAPRTRAQDEQADAIEHIIAAHRQVLLELAPHQDDRNARVEAGWHMERLGWLLRVRDVQKSTAGAPDADAPAAEPRRAAEPIA